MSMLTPNCKLIIIFIILIYLLGLNIYYLNPNLMYNWNIQSPNSRHPIVPWYTAGDIRPVIRDTRPWWYTDGLPVNSLHHHMMDDWLDLQEALCDFVFSGRAISAPGLSIAYLAMLRSLCKLHS